MTVGDHEIRFDALKELEVSMTGPSRDFDGRQVIFSDLQCAKTYSHIVIQCHIGIYILPMYRLYKVYMGYVLSLYSPALMLAKF